MLAKKLSMLVILAFMVQSAFSQPADITVSQNETDDAMFSSVQEAVNAAEKGMIIEILDYSVYEEQVTIDSSKHGITIRSRNPGSPNKPVIMWQDRENTHPHSYEETQPPNDIINFDQNGALRLMRVRGVTIDGICVDGGGAFPFAYPSIWGGKDEIFHGNSAICLYIAGDAIIRNCEVRNAYFGFNVKDRNVGGVFGNPNPHDNDETIPLSGFGRTGNHLIEYNRIHSNSWGFFFESTWDLGSTVRYNLIYNNYHTSATLTAISDYPGKDHQPGGAFQFKDGYISPIAIYNNTFWHNYMIFAGHWKPGGQHLIFNNIYGRPKYLWGTGYPGGVYRNPWHAMDGKCFLQRMKHCVYACQGQEAQTRSQNYYIECLRNSEDWPDGQFDASGYSQIQLSNDIQDGYIARDGMTFEIECTDGSTEQLVVDWIKRPGALISDEESFPPDAGIRWLETDDLFQSTDPESPNFLHPDWDNPIVQQFIQNAGWSEAGIRNSDGKLADLGAIPSSGSKQPTVVRIVPGQVVMVEGSNATVSFNVDVQSGEMNNPRIKYIRWIKRLPKQTNSAFGSTMIPLEADDIVEVDASGAEVKVGSNTLNFDLNETRPADGDSSWMFGFFEMVLEGEDASGLTVSSDVGFLPYRELNYKMIVEVRDGAGNLVTEVTAGQPVNLYLRPVEIVNGVEQPYLDEIDTVEVELMSDASASLHYADNDQPLFAFSGFQGEITIPVYFTKAGLENVKVTAADNDLPNNLVLPFPGFSDEIRVLPGPPEKVLFERPVPKRVAGERPPVISPGEKYNVVIKVTDRFDNPTRDPASVSISSLDANIGTVTSDVPAMSDTTGTVNFVAEVVNGKYGEIFDLVASLDANGASDTGALRVGRVKDRLIILYSSEEADVRKIDPLVTIDENCGVRVPVVIMAVNGDTLLTERNTEFELTLTANVEAYASEDAATPQTTFTLVEGQVTVWITATKDVQNGSVTAMATTENINYGMRDGLYFTRNISDVDYGVVYADNGLGQVNRLELYYLKDLTEDRLPDSVVLNWPRIGDEFRKRVERVFVTLDPENPKHVTVTFPDPFSEGVTSYSGSGNNLGTAYFWDPLTPDAPVQEGSFNVVDSVGPLIASGMIVERLTDGDDTLIISATELLRDPETNLEGASIDLIKSVTGDTINLDIAGVIPFGDQFKLVIRDMGDSAPKEGDQIRFNPAGTVVDNNGVAVHPENRPVTLSLRAIPPDVVTAYYFDNNADGVVELATITFNKKVRAEDVKITFDWVGNKTEQLGADRFSYGTDSTILNIDLLDVFPRSVANKTAGPMQLELFFEGFIETKFFTAVDKAAPVVTKAVYKIGEAKEDGTSEKDTLEVHYSEPLQEPAKDVDLSHVNLNQNGVLYTPALRFTEYRNDLNNGTYIATYVVEVLNFPNDGYPEEGDSVYINPEGGVSDGMDPGNFQDNASNRRVPLEVKAAPIKIKVVVGPNPFKFGTHFYSPELGRNTGVLVVIDPIVKLRDLVELSAEIVLYDNLGNIVLTDEIVTVEGNPKLFWGWDGYNKNGRAVGTGTYIAKFHITNLDENTTEIISKNIAVVR